MADPTDPSALFRQMLGQWEQMANNFGGDALKSDQFTRAMHGASAATMQAQEAVKATMERALAAANMPSREEVSDISARLARVEASLERIEAALAALAGAPAPRHDRPKPKRTRIPPSGG